MHFPNGNPLVFSGHGSASGTVKSAGTLNCPDGLISDRYTTRASYTWSKEMLSLEAGARTFFQTNPNLSNWSRRFLLLSTYKPVSSMDPTFWPSSVPHAGSERKKNSKRKKEKRRRRCKLLHVDIVCRRDHHSSLTFRRIQNILVSLTSYGRFVLFCFGITE